MGAGQGRCITSCLQMNVQCQSKRQLIVETNKFALMFNHLPCYAGLTSYALGHRIRVGN